MVTAHRCTAGRDTGCNRVDSSDSMDHCPKTLTTSIVNCCMACCYNTGVTVAAATTKGYCNRKTTKTTSTNAASSSVRAYADYDDPPSEAAAFVASASAAAFVLLVALLAVILTSVAVLSLASLAPTAVSAIEVRSPGLQATDYLHRWHQQQQPDQWHLQKQQQQLSSLNGGGDKDAVRRKRQLLKNINREPGVFALAFSLIGGTITDTREAYRNVSIIVRDTINEAAKAQQQPITTTAASASSAEGDQMMMAAGNSVENEISTTAPIDQKLAGDMFGKLFGRNYRGLRRLFNSELRTALKNSPGNVRDFAVELVGSIGQSLRPSNLFTRGPINGNTATTGSRR